MDPELFEELFRQLNNFHTNKERIAFLQGVLNFEQHLNITGNEEIANQLRRNLQGLTELEHN